MFSYTFHTQLFPAVLCVVHYAVLCVVMFCNVYVNMLCMKRICYIFHKEAFDFPQDFFALELCVEHPNDFHDQIENVYQEVL